MQNMRGGRERERERERELEGTGIIETQKRKKMRVQKEGRKVEMVRGVGVGRESW